MNINVPAVATTYAQKLHLEHKQRQARFAAAAKRERKNQDNRPFVPTAIPDRLKPLWMFGHISFDHHLELYASWKAEQRLVGGHRLKRYIRDRALELGTTYAVVVGSSRKKDVVKARQLITWEVKTLVKPEISFPELGRLFGGRDHTTILHAVRKIEAMRASS